MITYFNLALIPWNYSEFSHSKKATLLFCWNLHNKSLSTKQECHHTLKCREPEELLTTDREREKGHGLIVTIWKSYNRDVKYHSLPTSRNVRGGWVVGCRTCDREVVGSNHTNGYCVPMPTQRAIPPGLVNEYQRKLGSKRAYHAMH